MVRLSCPLGEVRDEDTGAELFVKNMEKLPHLGQDSFVFVKVFLGVGQDKE